MIPPIRLRSRGRLADRPTPARRAVAAWALACPVALAGCAILRDVFQPPSVSYDSAKFVAADWDSLRVDLHFDVHNPNAVGVQLDGYAMRFSVADLTLVDGDVDRPLDLRGGHTADLVVPVRVPWAKLAEKVLRGKGGEGGAGGEGGKGGKGGVPDQLPYEAGGALKFATPIGPLQIPFSQSGHIPVIKPPSVRPAGVRVRSASLSAVEIAVDFDVRNASAQAVSLLDLAHEIRLDGTPVVSGRLDAPLRVEGRGKARRSVVVQLSPLQVAGAVASALAGGGALDVAVAGRARVDTGYGELPWSYSASKRLAVTR